MKSYRLVGLMLLTAILTGIGYIYSHGLPGIPQRHEIAPGTEAFSVLPEEIMSLTFSTAGYKLNAQRSRPGAPFAVQITFANGRNLEQCQVSPDLAGQLEKLTTITVTRQLVPARLEVDFPTPIGLVEIRDRILPETLTALAFRASKDRSAVALSYEDYAVEVSTPATAFAKFDGGCKALGQLPASSH